jgi:transcriptional regulator with XRE-family HTH domain
MSINERFNKIIKTLFGGNKSAFANAIGVTPSVVDNIVGKRQGNPSFEVIEKVSSIAEINLDWLIADRGEPFNFQGEAKKAQTPRHSSEFELKLLDILSQKDLTIRQQAEELGQLREQLAQARREIEQVKAEKNESMRHPSPTRVDVVQ